MTAALQVVMYHYIRDLPNTPFPKIKGMLTRDFRDQLSALRGRYEMATLESALEFIHGRYRPERDLCILTFDDGLKEHYAEITPLLFDHRIQGLFFVITSCLEGRDIAPVHMNHFLMAALSFEEYRDAFLTRLTDEAPTAIRLTQVDASVARHSYRWDSPEVASFKYLFNFMLDPNLRDHILEELFEEKIGPIESFANSLYLNSEEAKEMQGVGMVIGGHSHQHKLLSSLSDEELETDLMTCDRVLKASLCSQPLWPFCYPYGKRDSFNSTVTKQLKQLGFVCSFSTEVGTNGPMTDLFALGRLDCKDVQIQ
jgi:peptidoglycan/xylan/chitin deacetylase (PgdA/CDA1 family)